MTVFPFCCNQSRTRALRPVLASRVVGHIPRYDGCTIRLFFSRNVVYSKFLKILDFCQQQQMHTPARACTRHPAKHGSKGLTCGLATAEHRLHCSVDHNNSGCCSGYEPARGEAQGHNNNLPNFYATVSFREMSRTSPIKFTSRYT